MATAATIQSVQDRGAYATGLTRLSSVDILRGLVMVIMALDHARDFFSNSATAFDPTDLAHTTPALFFTRWITHFCAPVFVFLAGTGSYLALVRGGYDRCALGKFLASRGLWLIFLEVFVVSPLGWSFSFSFGFTRLQVIWVIGVSMIILGALIVIWPSRLIGAVGIMIVLTHDIFDGPRAAWLGSGQELWKVLHGLAFFQPFPHKVVASLYPLIPWVGVMMAGYAAGELMTLAPLRRRRILLALGGFTTLLFVALRTLNVYGDPAPWSWQATPLYTLLSFVRCSKYPPSLLYLLMTLGPALFVLGWLDRSRASGWLTSRLRVFGRVPLFYYLLHLPLLHLVAVLLALWTYGDASWLFHDLMAPKGSGPSVPSGYGYGLPVVYAVWLLAVVLLYPVCQWFGKVKARRDDVVFRYL
jgi:uncharacterized membrane protein